MLLRLGFFEGIMTLKIDFKKVSAKVSNPALILSEQSTLLFGPLIYMFYVEI